MCPCVWGAAGVNTHENTIAVDYSRLHNSAGLFCLQLIVEGVDVGEENGRKGDVERNNENRKKGKLKVGVVEGKNMSNGN